MGKFKLQELQQNIFLVTEPYLTDFANNFLIVGDDKALLIDCGMGLFDIREFLHAQGYKNIRVTATHAHFDHVGGLKYFNSDEIIVTKQIAANLQNKELLALDYVYKNMINRKIMKLYDQRSPRKICRDYINNLENLLPKIVPAADMEEIMVGEFALRVIPTPGHANESIVLYEPNHQLLFSGDTLYDGNKLDNLPNSNITDFISSLSLLQKLDIKTTFPGHNQILNIEETRQTIMRWLQELNEAQT